MLASTVQLASPARLANTDRLANTIRLLQLYSVRPASTDRQKLVSVPEEDAAPERAGPGGRRGGEILPYKVNLDIFGKLVKF